MPGRRIVNAGIQRNPSIAIVPRYVNVPSSWTTREESDRALNFSMDGVCVVSRMIRSTVSCIADIKSASQDFSNFIIPFERVSEETRRESR